jgi:hypothetical protein
LAAPSFRRKKWRIAVVVAVFVVLTVLAIYGLVKPVYGGQTGLASIAGGGEVPDVLPGEIRPAVTTSAVPNLAAIHES